MFFFALVVFKGFYTSMAQMETVTVEGLEREAREYREFLIHGWSKEMVPTLSIPEAVRHICAKYYGRRASIDLYDMCPSFIWTIVAFEIDTVKARTYDTIKFIFKITTANKNTKTIIFGLEEQTISRALSPGYYLKNSYLLEAQLQFHEYGRDHIYRYFHNRFMLHAGRKIEMNVNLKTKKLDFVIDGESLNLSHQIASGKGEKYKVTIDKAANEDVECKFIEFI